MRVSVPLRQAARLLNHGPTTLISSAASGRRNVMAAAWVMPLDFVPPKLGVVIAADTYTRQLVESSGALVVNLPTVAQVDLTWTVGSCSGKDTDKFSAFGIETAPASLVEAPLIEGCVAWLEAKVLPDERLAKELDLFVVEVVAAWVDDTQFRDGTWAFTDDSKRTLHHVAKGRFLSTGAVLEARQLPGR